MSVILNKSYKKIIVKFLMIKIILFLNGCYGGYYDTKKKEQSYYENYNEQVNNQRSYTERTGIEVTPLPKPR